MSNKRIIHMEDGGQNGSTPPQQTRPIQMADLLQSAEDDCKAGNKNKAFITLVGGMGLMSQGIAQAMKTSDAAMAAVQRACGHRFDAVDAPCVYCGFVRKPEGGE